MSMKPRTTRRQGILPFVLTLGQMDDVTARAGLPLVIETNRALRLDEEARKLFTPPRRKDDYRADEQLEALSTLIAAGGDRAEDIRILGEDKGLVRLLGQPFPSPDSLLDFLNSFHDKDCMVGRPKGKKAFVFGAGGSAATAGLSRTAPNSRLKLNKCLFILLNNYQLLLNISTPARAL